MKNKEKIDLSGSPLEFTVDGLRPSAYAACKENCGGTNNDCDAVLNNDTNCPNCSTKKKDGNN